MTNWTSTDCENKSPHSETVQKPICVSLICHDNFVKWMTPHKPMRTCPQTHQIGKSKFHPICQMNLLSFEVMRHVLVSSSHSWLHVSNVQFMASVNQIHSRFTHHFSLTGSKSSTWIAHSHFPSWVMFPKQSLPCQTHWQSSHNPVSNVTQLQLATLHSLVHTLVSHAMTINHTHSKHTHAPHSFLFLSCHFLICPPTWHCQQLHQSHPFHLSWVCLMPLIIQQALHWSFVSNSETILHP